MDILVDTLSFRCNFKTWEDLLAFLNLNSIDEFEFVGKTFNVNYTSSYLYEGIRIAFGGSQGWYYYIHMSGKGCRTYEDIQGEGFNWYDLISKLYKYPDCYITRIDLACDEREGVFDIETLESHISDNTFVSHCLKSSMRLVKFGEECLYVGSPKSMSMLRIYNKKLERGFSDDDEEIPHWWRCEFQLRDERAMQVVREWCECGSVGPVFAGHVKKHIRFTNTVNTHNGNQNEYITADWWNDFLEHANALRWVSRKGSEYNLSRLQRYAIGNAGSSVKTLIKAKKLTADELYNIYMNADIKLRPDQVSFIEAHNKYLERGGEDTLIGYDKVITCEKCGKIGTDVDFNFYRGSIGICRSCSS